LQGNGRRREKMGRKRKRVEKIKKNGQQRAGYRARVMVRVGSGSQ